MGIAMKQIIVQILLLFCVQTMFWSQTKSQTTQIVDGKSFYVHKVQKKETLYSISKLYNISVEQIKSYNTSLKDGLKENQTILILNQSADNTSQTYQSHIVRKGETLYSISKFYQCAISEIEKANPELSASGLKEDMALNIPPHTQTSLPTQTQITQNDSTNADSIPQPIRKGKSRIQVGFFAPFFLKENAEKINEKDLLSVKSNAAFDVYAGIKIALDSLKKEGLSSTLHVFDTENKTTTIDSLLKEIDVSKFDLIIGPLYNEMFKKVSAKANALKIPIICPVPISKKILLSSPYTFKSFPARSSRHDFLQQYLSKNHKDDKLIIIDQKNKYKSFAKSLAEHHNKAGASTRFISSDTAKYFSLWQVKLDPVIKAMSDSKNNVVVVLSTDKAFVTEILTSLYMNADKKITLFGEEKWKSFNFIDTKYLDKLNVHLTCSADQTDERIVSLKAHRYATSPSKYFLSGYNSMFFWGTRLKQYGEEAISFAENTYDGIGMGFTFDQKGEESGFENTHSVMFKFDNFKYIRVK